MAFEAQTRLHPSASSVSYGHTLSFRTVWVTMQVRKRPKSPRIAPGRRRVSVTDRRGQNALLHCHCQTNPLRNVDNPQKTNSSAYYSKWGI